MFARMFSTTARKGCAFAAGAVGLTTYGYNKLPAELANTVNADSFDAARNTHPASRVKASTIPKMTDYNGMDPKEFVPLEVESIRTLSDDTAIYTFALSSDYDFDENVLPQTFYVLTKAPLGEDGKAVIRPYTPIPMDAPGLHLLVKSYPKGTMSKHFGQLDVGSQLEVKGPLPKVAVEADKLDHITLIAGGTGLTPVYQILKKVVGMKGRQPQVHLVYGNISEDDILLKYKLRELAELPNVKITYVLDKPSKDIPAHVGYMTKEFLESTIAKPDPKHKVYVCGPPGMMKAITGPKAPDYSQGPLDGVLKTLGFTESDVYKF